MLAFGQIALRFGKHLVADTAAANNAGFLCALALVCFFESVLSLWRKYTLGGRG